MKNLKITLLALALPFALGASALDAGVKLMAEKKYPQAVRALEKEAKANPGSPEVLLNLGWAYWHAKRLEDAWRIGSTLVKLDPQNVSFLVFKANTSIERKDYSGAARLARRALDLSPDHREGTMVLAKALFRLKQEKEAMLLLDQLMAKNPDDRDAEYKRAMFAAELGQRGPALAALERLLKADPTNVSYRRSRAKILSELGRPQEAKAEWESLTRGHPDAQSLLNLGWAYWHEARFDEARDIGSMLLKLDDKNPTFLRFMANMEIEKLNFEEALRLSEKALALVPGDRDALLTKSRALYRQQREEEASAIVKSLIEKYPDHAAVQYHWADYLARSGRPKEALGYLEKLIKGEPANGRYRLSRAAALYALARFDESVAELKKLAGEKQTREDAVKRLRDDAVNRRDWVEAATWQDKVIDIDPSDPLQWERLARIHMEAMKLDDALAAAEKAIAVDPAWISAYYLKAEVLEQLQDWPAAGRAYEDIIDRNPNTVRALEGMSRVMEGSGDFAGAAKAVAQLEKMIAPSVSPYLELRRARLLAEAGKPKRALAMVRKLSAKREPIIPILMYHGITLHDRSDGVTQDLFRDQLRALKEAGYKPMTVSELDKVLQGKAPLPEKPILLTFDDGRSDSFENADPVLKEMDFRATMFVHLSQLRKPYFHASPKELQKWQATGRWEMQAHGEQAHDPMALDAAGRLGHFLPNRKWLAEAGRLETIEEFRTRVETDYRHAKERLEAMGLNANVVGFAYPFGDYGQNDYSNNPQAALINQELVRKYFRLAFVQEPIGINTLSSNPTDLRRYEVPKTMSGDTLVARTAVNDPWVQAKLVEAHLWVQAEQPGRAELIFAELEKEGISESRLWAAEGSASSKRGDLSTAKELFERAYGQASQNGGHTAELFRRQLEQAEIAAGIRPTFEGQHFYDTNRNRISKAGLRIGAPIQATRLEVWGAQGTYDDRFDPDGNFPETIRSNEAGGLLRWFVTPRTEVAGSYSRRKFTEGYEWQVDNHSITASHQLTAPVRAELRHTKGNVETANAVRAQRELRTYGGSLIWDPALNWTTRGEYDFTTYNDDNRQHDLRFGVTRRINERLSLGGQLYRGDSLKNTTPQYFSPQNQYQASAIVTVTQPIGRVRPEIGAAPIDLMAQYGGGYNRQPTGSRVVHSIRGAVTLRPFARLSVIADGRYSEAPNYTSRAVEGRLAYSF